MAVFTTNKVDYINKTSKIGMEEKFSSYTKFLEQAPIFVTYYKQNILETTTDIGMGNTYEMIGAQSSITYNKINHIPLYGVDVTTFDLDYDDITGINGSAESSGVLLPNTVEPIPNDYFTVDYMDHKYIYKIMNMETEDHIKSNNYYKINFKYDGENTHDIDKQISDSYTCIYDNIGTEDVSIIRNDILTLCTDVETKMIALHDLYLDKFLFNTTNSLILPISENKYLYDPYLTEFVSRNKVFVRNRSFKTYNIINIIELGDDFNESYISSIYRMIEKKSIRDFSVRSRYLNMKGHSNYFELCGDVYYKADLQKIEDVGNTDFIFYNLYSELITPLNISIEEVPTNIVSKVVEVIKMYMSDTHTNEEILTEFIKLEDVYIRKDLNNFIYFPILFYIIQKSMDNIIIKK